LGDDAEETAVTHDRDHAGHRPRRRLIDAVEPRTRTWGAHDAPMHHARWPHILHIGDAAGHFVWDIETRNRFPDDLMGRWWLGSDLRRRLAMQVDLRREFPIADLASVGRSYSSIGDGEHVGCNTEALGREIEENCAHFRARKPQRSAAIFDRLAAGCDAFIRAASCIRRKNTHAGER